MAHALAGPRASAAADLFADSRRIAASADAREAGAGARRSARSERSQVGPKTAPAFDGPPSIPDIHSDAAPTSAFCVASSSSSRYGSINVRADVHVMLSPPYNRATSRGRATAATSPCQPVRERLSAILAVGHFFQLSHYDDPPGYSTGKKDSTQFRSECKSSRS